MKEFKEGEEVIYAPMPNEVFVVKKVYFFYLILVNMNSEREIEASKSLVSKKPLTEPNFGRRVDDPPIFKVGDAVTYNGLNDRYFSIIKLSPDGATALLEGYHGEFEQGLSCIWLPCHELTHIRDVAFIPQHQRPPRGLIPRKYVDENRLVSIDDAVSRYIEAGYPIPAEWVEERNEILLRLGGK